MQVYTFYYLVIPFLERHFFAVICIDIFSCKLYSKTWQKGHINTDPCRWIFSPKKTTFKLCQRRKFYFFAAAEKFLEQNKQNTCDVIPNKLYIVFFAKSCFGSGTFIPSISNKESEIFKHKKMLNWQLELEAICRVFFRTSVFECVNVGWKGNLLAT